MRIKLISVVIFIILISTCFSQESEKSFNHQLDISLHGGMTTDFNLKPKFGYMYGLNYTIRNPKKRVRLSMGAAINHYRTKTHKKYHSYYPQSDTFTVLHWSNILYEFQLKMDFIIKENDVRRLYFTLGWNVGSYIERKRTAKRYDESQNDKLISKTTIDIGQPIDNVLFGRVIGLGYERYINDSWSFYVAPSMIYKANIGFWDVHGFVFIGLNTGLKLNF